VSERRTLDAILTSLEGKTAKQIIVDPDAKFVHPDGGSIVIPLSMIRLIAGVFDTDGTAQRLDIDPAGQFQVDVVTQPAPPTPKKARQAGNASVGITAGVTIAKILSCIYEGDGTPPTNGVLLLDATNVSGPLVTFTASGDDDMLGNGTPVSAADLEWTIRSGDAGDNWTLTYTEE